MTNGDSAIDWLLLLGGVAVLLWIGTRDDNEPAPREISMDTEYGERTSGTSGTPGFRSFKGQSHTSYCLECCLKHLSTAKKLNDEAIDRSLKSGQGIKDKMRVVVDELAGMEDDFPKGDAGHLNRDFERLSQGVRSVRKEIYAKNLDTTNTSKRDLREVRGKLQKLQDMSYAMKEKDEACPGCADEEAVAKVQKAIGLIA